MTGSLKAVVHCVAIVLGLGLGAAQAASLKIFEIKLTATSVPSTGFTPVAGVTAGPNPLTATARFSYDETRAPDRLAGTNAVYALATYAVTFDGIGTFTATGGEIFVRDQTPSPTARDRILLTGKPVSTIAETFGVVLNTQTGTAISGNTLGDATQLLRNVTSGDLDIGITSAGYTLPGTFSGVLGTCNLQIFQNCIVEFKLESVSEVAPVPLPAGGWLMLGGLGLLGAFRMRKTKA